MATIHSNFSILLPTTRSYDEQSYIDFVASPANSSFNLNSSASIATIKGVITTGSNSRGVQGRLNFYSSKENLTDSEQIFSMYFSGSNNSPRVGIGIKEASDVEGIFDIRSPSGSIPASITLRTNEDGVIEVGEETGRITFAIESSSYLGTDFIASGSTSAIYSKILGTATNGSYGSLIFEVNDNNSVTEPIEAMTIGYGLGPSSTDIGFILSGSIKTTAGANVLSMKSSTSDEELVRLGYVTSDIPEFDRGSLLLRDDGNTQVSLNWSTSDFLNTGNNFGVGTISPSEKLTVEGNISASGDITTNTFNTIETTLSSDSTTNVDTFAITTYKGAIYDYVLYDVGVGARTGQFMVIQDNSNIDFTDNSTPTIGPETTIPTITATVSGSNVEVKVTNGNGYTFKAFTKKL